jgi:hypothetical protein
MRTSAISLMAFMVLAVSAPVLLAGVPSLVNYQGILTDSGGSPLDGTYNLTFRIYADSTTGTPALWAESHGSVDVEDGLFNVILGSNVPLLEDVFSDTPRWLGITVAPNEEVYPKMRLTSTPWAFRAAVADTVLNVPATGDGHSLDAADGYPEDVVYVDDDGYVGIGITPMLGTKLYVDGEIKVPYSQGFYVGAYEGLGWNGMGGDITVGSDVETVGLLVYAGSTTPSMVLESGTGEVGIGTDTPAARLNVVGEVQIEKDSGRALDVIHAATSVSQAVNFYATGDLNSGNDMLQIYMGAGSSNTCQFIECERGSDIEFAVYGDGNVYADGSYTGPADFSEMVAVSTGASSAEPGDVMVIDPAGSRSLVRASEPRSRLVAGIYSTRPGFVGSERDWARPGVGNDAGEPAYSLEALAGEFDEIPLAVVGIVPCKVSAENGPIRPGDLLVTSSTPGHAMRDADPAVGTVLGKALEALPSGTGVIKALVTLQ